MRVRVGVCVCACVRARACMFDVCDMASIDSCGGDEKGGCKVALHTV